VQLPHMTSFMPTLARLRVPLGFVFGAVALWLAAPSWSSLLAGSMIATVGEGVRIYAAGHIEKGREVTKSGPYRFTRHPLYVGSALIGMVWPWPLRALSWR
jgi:protein-S-isoprenylcysteine O-methyltransferase Ste14